MRDQNVTPVTGKPCTEVVLSVFGKVAAYPLNFIQTLHELSHNLPG